MDGLDNLKIVHVAGVAPKPTGGMGRIAYYWRKQFQARGHTFDHIGPGEVGKVWHYSAFSWQAARFLRRANRQPDVLLLHESAAWAFRAEQRPKVIFSHGLEARFAAVIARSADGRRLHKLLFARLYQHLIMCELKSAELVLVSSREDESYLLRVGLTEKRIRVFQNGADSTDLATKVKRAAFCPTVLFNASWIERKGIHVLLSAAAGLAEQGVPVKWLLIGAGKSAAEVLADWPEPLRSLVTVVPHFDAHEEVLHLAAADIFVLPSFFEGQPLSLLQAMEAGLPCVTTNCCGQRDVIVHDENGLLFEPGDAQALGRHIRRLVEQAELRARLGQAAATTVAGRSWTKVSNDVVDDVLQAVDRYRTDHAGQ